MVVEIPVWQNVAIGGKQQQSVKSKKLKFNRWDTACGEVLNNPSGGWETVHDELEGG